jgi:hypothetical protein
LISEKIISIIKEANSTIFSARAAPSEARHLLYFKDGLARYYVGSPNGQELTLALSNLRRTVGEFEFVTGTLFGYSCKSVDLCIVLQVGTKEVLDII